MNGILSGTYAWSHVEVSYATLHGDEFFRKFEIHIKEAVDTVDRLRPTALEIVPKSGFVVAITYHQADLWARLWDCSLPDSKRYQTVGDVVYAWNNYWSLDELGLNPVTPLLEKLADDLPRKWPYWLERRRAKRCAKPDWLVALEVERKASRKAGARKRTVR
jgi:hypothetical protein